MYFISGKMYQGKLDMEYRTRNREGKLGRPFVFNACLYRICFMYGISRLR